MNQVLIWDVCTVLLDTKRVKVTLRIPTLFHLSRSVIMKQFDSQFEPRNSRCKLESKAGFGHLSV